MVVDKTNPELCAVTVIHEDVLNKVRAGLTEQKHLRRMAEMFKVMNDPTRLKIVNALLIAEMCVCDIAALMGMTQPSISHHLKVLRQSELIKYRREGKVVYYSLDDEHVGVLFQNALEHASEPV
ncbi:MAG: metalloregulator ArsR/SmtB family transcription factor [Oscillospiraceae bacterium]|nr:metalloregulator ArsR/SmtB family transcription factor [Oscillospiraceae bacterium]